MDEKEKEAMRARIKLWMGNFLTDWDGNCLICGKPVGKEDLWPNRMPDIINGAVVGEYIGIYGHRNCLRNVDRIVVLQNRIRVNSFVEKLKEQFSSMKEADEMLQGILKMIDLVGPDKVGRA